MAKAVRGFKDKDVKESSVRDWNKLFEKELKERLRSAGVEEVRVESLPCQTRGRPPLLGEKLDKYLQETITDVRSRGTAIGSTIVVAVAHGILLKHDKQRLKNLVVPLN